MQVHVNWQVVVNRVSISVITLVQQPIRQESHFDQPCGSLRSLATAHSQCFGFYHHDLNTLTETWRGVLVIQSYRSIDRSNFYTICVFCVDSSPSYTNNISV